MGSKSTPRILILDSAPWARQAAVAVSAAGLAAELFPGPSFFTRMKG